MGKNVFSFILAFVLAFGAGYLVYQTDGAPEQAAQVETKDAEKQDNQAQAQPAAASAEGEIFVQRGCTACHAVSALGVQGGATGPDLSQAYVNVEGKHGVPIEQFLKKPTSAVMSGVLGGKPLTEDELKSVLAALKKASEK